MSNFNTFTSGAFNTSEHPVNLILSRLNKVRSIGIDRWTACCPAHDDSTPSLSIKSTQDRVLLHCWAGCDTNNVTAAMGLSLSDLFVHKSNFDKNAYRKSKQWEEDKWLLAVAAADAKAGRIFSTREKERVRAAMKRAGHE
jgi:hypothetical protein